MQGWRNETGMTGKNRTSLVDVINKHKDEVGQTNDLNWLWATKRARDRGKTFWDLYVSLLLRVWLRTIKFGTEMHEAGKRSHRFGGIYSSHLNKKLSYLDKPARRDCRSVKSPNIAPFHMLDIVSYCAIVTLSFTIFDFKNVVTLKSGSEVTQGHWKWFHSIECVWFPISVL